METRLRKRNSDENSDKVKVPRSVDWEIKDLVRPVVLRRKVIWRTVAGVVIVLLAALFSWRLFFAPPTGEALLAHVVQAAGGMDSWNAIADGSFDRVHTIFDENGEAVRTDTETFFFRKGDDWKLLIESESDFGHAVIGRDQEGYWATREGEPASPVVVARSLGMMCESEYCTPQCAAEMALFRFSLPFKLTDPGVQPRFAGTADLNGRDVSVLEITYDPEIGSDRWVFFVDPETKLIRKVEHYGSLESDAAPEAIYWSDHREVDGITFSHRQTYYRTNGSKLEEYVIRNVQFNRSLADEMFIRPESRVAAPASLEG